MSVSSQEALLLSSTISKNLWLLLRTSTRSRYETRSWRTRSSISLWTCSARRFDAKSATSSAVDSVSRTRRRRCIWCCQTFGLRTTDLNQNKSSSWRLNKCEAFVNLFEYDNVSQSVLLWSITQINLDCIEVSDLEHQPMKNFMLSKIDEFRQLDRAWDGYYYVAIDWSKLNFVYRPISGISQQISVVGVHTTVSIIIGATKYDFKDLLQYVRHIASNNAQISLYYNLHKDTPLFEFKQVIDMLFAEDQRSSKANVRNTSGIRSANQLALSAQATSRQYELMSKLKWDAGL